MMLALVIALPVALACGLFVISFLRAMQAEAKRKHKPQFSSGMTVPSVRGRVRG